MTPGLAPMVTTPRWLPRHRQLGVVGQVAWGLGANTNGAKLPAWMALNPRSIF
nr:hypothetical protein Sh142J21g_390 [Saccharum hybrid cultivar R570]